MECFTSKFDSIIPILQKFALNSALSFKHGACLLRSNKIVSLGVNKYYEVKVKDERVKLSIHAEVDALASSKNTKGMDLLIIRVSPKKHLLGNSRPCNTCIEKLKQKGIKRVYYSNSEGHIVFEWVDDMVKTHVTSGNTFRQRLE